MYRSTIHGTIIVPWPRIWRANYSCTPRMEFETGAPNLTTAFDDNVSFFVISSNLTIHLSLFVAVCGVTCFVCNFRNPCTISAPKRRKKRKRCWIYLYRRKILLTHTIKKHLLSKMTPLEVIKCYLFKTNQYVRVCIFSLKIDNISERRETETTRKK